MPTKSLETEVPSRTATTADTVRFVRDPGLPAAQGLYDPSNEKDSCGVGFIADMKNRKSHAIVEQGLPILHNLDHRGAVGADPKMGDGCGILVQIPHGFFAAECAKLGIALPEAGQYGVGHLFMPRDPEGFALVEEIVTKAIADEGLQLPRLARRAGRFERPRREREGDRAAAPPDLHRQGQGHATTRTTFERRLFIARKVISNAVYDMKDPRTAGYYPVSLSSRTIVYKGMVLVTQLGDYYLDLQDQRFESAHRPRAPALLHQHLPDLAARPSLPDGRP